MRVLYITHSCPYPPNKGDRIRNFHILKHLATTHEVTLIYPSFTSDDMEQAEILNKFCCSVKTVKMSKTMGKIKCCLSLFGSQPLTNAYFYSQSLQDLIDGESCDAIVVDCSSMAQYVMAANKPRIIDFVDVDSDKWRNYAERTMFPKSMIYQREYRQLQRLEAQLVKEFDASIVISEEETIHLPKSDRLFVVRNGIDLDYFSPRGTPNSNTIIFTGAMNYFPNIDGVLFFHEEILPRIQEEIPSVKLIIGGMEPDQKIQQLESAHVVVTGFVPDMRDYLEKASVCVVPLRIAKGIQNKVLEAMAMGIPVVSTSGANKGINAVHNRDLIVADDANTFADAVVRMLRHENLRNTIASNARRFVEAQFSWQHNLQQMDQAMEMAMRRK